MNASMVPGSSSFPRLSSIAISQTLARRACRAAASPELVREVLRSGGESRCHPDLALGRAGLARLAAIERNEAQDRPVVLGDHHLAAGKGPPDELREPGLCDVDLGGQLPRHVVRMDDQPRASKN